MCIYIYIRRERERCMYIYIYTYTYILTYTPRAPRPGCCGHGTSGGTKRATSVSMPLLRLRSSEGKTTTSRKIEPVRRSLGPSAGAEVPRLRKWRVWCPLGTPGRRAPPCSRSRPGPCLYYVISVISLI